MSSSADLDATDLLGPLIGPADASSSENDKFTCPATNSEILIMDPNLEGLPPVPLVDNTHAFAPTASNSAYNLQPDGSISWTDWRMEVYKHSEVSGSSNASAFDLSTPSVIEEINVPSTRSNSLQPSLSFFTSPQEAIPKGNQAKRSGRKKQQQANEKKPEEEAEAKRERYLERNRRAASKCRKKKKALAKELHEEEKSLKSVHSSLSKEYDSLVDDVNELKNLLVSHSGCDDRRIDEWVQNEARKFVENSRD